MRLDKHDAVQYIDARAAMSGWIPSIQRPTSSTFSCGWLLAEGSHWGFPTWARVSKHASSRCSPAASLRPLSPARLYTFNDLTASLVAAHAPTIHSAMTAGSRGGSRFGVASDVGTPTRQRLAQSLPECDWLIWVRPEPTFDGVAAIELSAFSPFFSLSDLAILAHGYQLMFSTSVYRM